MRAIKFRGKCIESGEFVYGDLIHGVGRKDGKIFILPIEKNLASVPHCDPLDGVKVDPETVGQFTGLKDENKNEIYEADILLEANTQYKFKVYYANSMADYGIENIEDEYDDRQLFAIYKPEIIGNIHDNPELLNK